MPESPDEWRRLTELYAGMYDGQLLELGASLNDLTDMARTVLRDEMRKRGLGDPLSPGWADENKRAREDAERALRAAETEAAETAADGTYTEYSWKVVLCECDETVQAYQVREMLRRARIDAWVQPPRVLVAADQLDEASAVIANPIPQDIIDESRMEIPAFASPVCPSCGAVDPILLAADPSNSWECESCGNEWTDPLDDRAQAT
jgi:hypothetical protein